LTQVRDDLFRLVPLLRHCSPPSCQKTEFRADHFSGGGPEPFLIVYYGSDGSGGWQPIDRPLRTLTTLDRFGLVTWNRNTPMLRMLQPPELQRAMGFNGHYVLPFGTRRDRIKLLGNGVCPPVMKAVVQSLLFRDRRLRRRPSRIADTPSPAPASRDNPPASARSPSRASATAPMIAKSPASLRA